MSMSEDDEFSHQSQLALEISRHEIRKLRAKLQAAEAEVADHMAGESRLLELANFWQEKANNLQAEVARLEQSIKAWDMFGTEARLRTRIAELEAAIRDWYEWSGSASMDDEPLERLIDIAKALPDGRGE